MARWMGRDVRLDPRPGGEMRIDYNGTDIATVRSSRSILPTASS
jgi:hypothetical protein